MKGAIRTSPPGEQKPVRSGDARSVDLTFLGALELLRSKQKPSFGAPAYSRFVNRPLGRYVAAMAYKVRLTPNGVTAISGIFSFSAIIVIACVSPSWLSGVAICLGLVLGYVFDSADGQLARLRGGGSPSGEWLDHMVDATKISSLHLAVLIGFYRFGEWPGDAWLLVPIGYTIVASVMFFGLTLIDQLRRQHRDPLEPVVPREPTLLRSLIVLPTDYGLLCLSFAIFGWREGFTTLYTLFFAGNVLFLLLALGKWYRETRALGRAGAPISNADIQSLGGNEK